MTDEYKAVNQTTDPRWNREPGIAVIPDSNFAREVSKFEQFPSIWTAGSQPGNPYTYRPYPKMLYRAQHYQGKVCCMAAKPDEAEFKDPREFERAEEAARRFTDKCQLVVNDETERSRAMEQGWREDPDEAVSYLLGRDRAQGAAAAELNYADRGLTGGALKERQEALAEAHAEGHHLAEVPVKRKRGRPRRSETPTA